MIEQKQFTYQPSTDELIQYSNLLSEIIEKTNTLKELQQEPINIEFLTINEVSEILDCCDSTTKKLFNDPEFNSENYTKEKKILASEFIKFFSVRRDKNNSIYWQKSA